ncbi:hypothetical protein [Fervidobacterium gondwanense]|uniref:hypothetical protein n=1 Tax=Fervidobacterium gondwanense TaxID=44754 RepID=UPI003C74D3DE
MIKWNLYSFGYFIPRWFKWEDATKFVTVYGTYEIGDWVFQESKLEIELIEVPDEVRDLREIYEFPWERFKVLPTEKTIIAKRGNLEDISETEFEKLALEEDTEKS